MTRPSQPSIKIRASFSLNGKLTLTSGPVDLVVRGAAVRVVQVDDHQRVEVMAERRIDPEALRALELLADGKAPPGTDRKHPDIVHRDEWDGEPLIDAKGKVRGNWALPFGALPSLVRDEITAAYGAVVEPAHSFGEAMRWRLAMTGHHRTIGGMSGPEWSKDGSAWARLPGDLSARIWAHSQPRLEGAAKRDVERLATDGPPPPVSYELLLEAEDNRVDNERSCLLLCIAALETGIKRYVADVAPAAAWLAFEAPSPPIIKIIRDYLPTLGTARGYGISAPPKDVQKLLVRGVEATNQLSHKGGAAFPGADLDKLLHTVRELLYTLDWFLGEDWALEHVDPRIRKLWGVRK